MATGWGSSGTNVFTTLGGNVGIGTQNPSATLERSRGPSTWTTTLFLATGHGCRSFTLSVATGDLADALAGSGSVSSARKDE